MEILYNTLVLCAVLNNQFAETAYKIGVGRADCTGPAAGINLMGYSDFEQTGSGIHLRQFARAFIIEDGSNSIVFVSADTASISHGLRKEVISRLQASHGRKYNDNNIIMSGTHTHSGPGGYLLYLLYDSAVLGFVQETFDAYVEGIYRAIVRASCNLVDGRVFINSGLVYNVSINRSPKAYLENLVEDIAKYSSDVDRELVQLKFIRLADNQPIGIINWFAIHPVSMKSKNTLISSDNVGYASLLLENLMNPNDLLGKGSFVASFASSNLGDVTANIKGPKCIDTGKPCDGLIGSCNGNSFNCIATGPGNTDFESTKIIGERLASAAKIIFDGDATEITGEIKSNFQYMEMSSQTVEYKMKNGTTVTGKGCLPAIGTASTIGSIDGSTKYIFPGPIWTTSSGNAFADLFVRTLDVLLKTSQEDIDCHAPKSIVLNCGRATFPYEWLPKIIPTQIVTIGSLVLVPAPGEFTTMAGRKLRETLAAIMKTKPGVDKDEVKVIIAGLSNAYSCYITTPEEYNVQSYEGGVTLYGMFTLPIFLKQYQMLLTSLIKGVSVPIGIPPPDYPAPRLTTTKPILGDSLPLFTEAGDCLRQPPKSVKKGTVVKAVFQSGHPRNNLRQEDTFLTIEMMQTNKSWQVIATDANWETKFNWERKSPSIKKSVLGTSIVTIEWSIPLDAIPGIYRIGHRGDFKPFLKSVYSYSGYSNNFIVI